MNIVVKVLLHDDHNYLNYTLIKIEKEITSFIQFLKSVARSCSMGKLCSPSNI